ncbi:hypothetical protein [Nostoc sp.]|uniref:hypothetical protein n=1 Tax=Nostoc sp. TaxID=1180 RepID=UPI002FF5B8E9
MPSLRDVDDFKDFSAIVIVDWCAEDTEEGEERRERTVEIFRRSLFCFAQSRSEAIAYSKSSILLLCKGNQILYDYKH